MIKRQTHIVNDWSVDCKKTDSLGAWSLTSQASAGCAFSCIMTCFSCAAMVFRYSKRARTFFTKYVPLRSFGGHVTWNSAVPDPNVWCCIVLFLCTLAYHMSRVGFYGEDQSEALKRHVVLSHTTCISITRVRLTSDLPVLSAPEIFQSAMWYGIIPAWVVLCHTTWLENSKRERSMKGSFPPVVFRNQFEWRWA